MKKDFILRAGHNPVSGYKKLIQKTFSILKNDFDLTFLTLDGAPNNFLGETNKLTKDNFGAKELIITPLLLDRYSSLINCLPDKSNLNIFTMWESSMLPKFPVEEFNYLNGKIMVPSKWNKAVFERSGVKNVVHCPMFVDDKIFKFKKKKNLKTFTFLAGACGSFETGNSRRKNLDIILSAFSKAFRNIKDVQLIFKVSQMDRKNIGLLLDDRINFLTDNFTDEQISECICESDVFVSGSKAEGWGFFQIESLAVGRPVITVDYGGVKDFCNSDNSFFIDFEEELASGAWGKNGGLWANIKEESLAEKMFHCYKNKDTIRNNWQKYSKSVLPTFSIDNFKKNLLFNL